MFSKDQLNQLRTVIREEVEAEGKKTRQDQLMERMKLQGDVKDIRNRVKDVEISNTRLEERMLKLEQGQEELAVRVEAHQEFSKKAHEQLVDIITRTADDLREDHEKRIEALEVATGLVGSKH